MNMIDVAGMLIPRVYFAVVLVTRIRNAPPTKGRQGILLAVLLLVEMVSTIVTLTTDHRWSALQPISTAARLGIAGVVLAACAVLSGVPSASAADRASRCSPVESLHRALQRVAARVDGRRYDVLHLLRLCVALALLVVSASVAQDGEP